MGGIIVGERLHNKLVRDGIPAVIENDGHRAITHIVAPDERDEVLIVKLTEEVRELGQALTRDEIIAERADIAEVLRVYDELIGLTSEIIEKARRDKFAKRGGFTKFIFLEKEITND